MDNKDQLGRGLSWLGLALLISYSAVAVFYFGRGLSFITDEYSIMGLVGQASFKEMLNPYIGHLTVLSQLIYKLILENFSNQTYIPFQAGVIISKAFLAIMMFIYVKKRVNDIFALMISAVVLFISVDWLHYFFGNGIIIVLSLAFGVAALNLFDLKKTWADVGASLMLILAAATYTTGVPFIVALFVGAVLFRRRAIWVSLIPLFGYFIWHILIASKSKQVEDSGVDFSNLLDFPAWTVEGTAFVFRALFGNNEAFLNIPVLVSVILALLFFLLIAILLIYKKIDLEILIPLSALLALFSAQSLVGEPGSSRNPTIERYLYPDAVLFLLTFSYFLTIVRFKAAYFTGALLTLIIIFSNLVFIAPKNEGMSYVNSWLKSQITAIKIAQTSVPQFDLILKIDPKRNLPLRDDFNLEGAERFGELGFKITDLPLADNSSNLVVDNFLALNYRLKLLEPISSPVNCQKYKSGQLIDIYPPGVILSSKEPVQVKIGRFSRYPRISLGKLVGSKELLLPGDISDQVWQIKARPKGKDMFVCQRSIID